MKTNANSLRIGNIIEYQKQSWKILKKDHVKPGKGGAYVQLEMKDINNGTKTNIRFSSSEDVEVAYVEQKNYQYQYNEQNQIAVMDMESYEQHFFDINLAGDASGFLKEGMDIRVEFCNDNPISIILPETVEVEVISADAVVKGQTATASYKPAIIEGDIKVLVPQFIESGDRIIVKTEDRSYVERAKK